MCIDGEAEAYICPDNLHFNTETAQCDRPERVKCTPVDGDGGNKDGDGEDATLLCPREGGPMFPVGNDCKLAYICDEKNVARVYPCAEGLLYDHIGQYCTQPEHARCFAPPLPPVATNITSSGGLQ